MALESLVAILHVRRPFHSIVFHLLDSGRVGDRPVIINDGATGFLIQVINQFILSGERSRLDSILGLE